MEHVRRFYGKVEPRGDVAENSEGTEATFVFLGESRASLPTIRRVVAKLGIDDKAAGGEASSTQGLSVHAPALTRDLFNLHL